MKKIVFISDFFEHQVQGGAEICDGVLIETLKEMGCKIATFNCTNFGIKHLELYLNNGYNFIISNFMMLHEHVKRRLEAVGHRYVIMEHDHKYVTNKNPAQFKDFVVPKQNLMNVSFYKAAKRVLCQTSKHQEVLQKNLEISNVESLGFSLWSDAQLEFLRNVDTTKNGKAFIMKDPNPIKGLHKAEEYCKKNNIEYDLVDKLPYEQFIETLAKYEKFVFFPTSLESFSRVILEARMLGCKLLTNSFNGCTYEEWFKKYKGKELINLVQSQRKSIAGRVLDYLYEYEEKKDGDITVILNCYRRPYNLKMQIEAIREQTVKPAQVWLWVNYHEDNKDFDFSTLDVDKTFKNNFNWKFYGRFAAALLADTEFIAMYDDDTIPGPKWHENCIQTMKTHEGILGSAGVILNGSRYLQHDRCGWPTNNEKVVPVDLVGHSWFFKREWLRYLWQEKPVTWDNGEDIQFGFMAKIHGGIQTYCPPHPADNKAMHGSILGNELGIDEKATSNNRAVSHQQFFSERDECVQEGLKKGWQTVRGVKL